MFHTPSGLRHEPNTIEEPAAETAGPGFTLTWPGSCMCVWVLPRVPDCLGRHDGNQSSEDAPRWAGDTDEL